MGANTIRVLSCGSSVGTSTSIEPARSNFSKAGTAQWDTHDYVIFAAREYGLRVIITLTDDYDTYYGSKYTFLRWRSASTNPYSNPFYTQGNIIFDFTTYVKALLNHVNPYTKKAWKSDPTIIGWESINEGGAYIGKEGYPPASWTSNIGSTIKGLAPSQLYIDGTDGIYNYSSKATAPGLGVSYVDVVSDHGYPRNIGLLNAEIPLATNANKVFFIGEYDWTNAHGGDSLASYLSKIEGSSINGDMIWSIQGHDAQCCSFVAHVSPRSSSAIAMIMSADLLLCTKNDGYSLYYGSPFNTADEKANILLVTQHFYRMTGRKVPTSLPAVACPQPVF